MFNQFIVLLACVASLHAAQTTGNQLDNYTFETYIKEYGFPFNSDEMEMRRGLFVKELERVKAHNSRPQSWIEGLNKFSIMTTAEKSAFHGRSKNAKAATKPKYAKSLPADFKLKAVSELPSSVDWRDTANVVSAVKDQGQCGSCWAFAATATIESHAALASGLLFDLSPQQIAMCAPNPDSCGGTGGCEGSTAELAFEYLSGSKGQFEEFQYPYISYFGVDQVCNTDTVSKRTSPKAMIDGYVQLPANNYTALMNAVATVGPIAISVDASAWSAYRGGVFNGCNQAQPDIDHAVVLVGYGVDAASGSKYWLVRNSWSASWGEAGYIKLFREDEGATSCGQDTTPQDGTACAGDNEPQTVCGTCGILFDSSYPLSPSAK